MQSCFVVVSRQQVYHLQQEKNSIKINAACSSRSLSDPAVKKEDSKNLEARGTWGGPRLSLPYLNGIHTNVKYAMLLYSI
jgi:hypothetical protein